MLQVCGKQSTIPYYISAADINVYSLEEINYFIYDHMNLIYREFFCPELYDYIELQLGRADLAEQLRNLEKKDAQVRDFIMCIFKGSNYYSANDLAAVSELVTGINSMTRTDRMTVEAENLLKQKKYESALHIYFDILNNMEQDGEKQAYYARIAFSIGIIYARLFMSRNANAYFSYAYELFPDPAYAKACVYMSVINNDDEELLRTIIRYKVSDEALEAVRKKVESMKQSIAKSSGMQAFMHDAEKSEGFENIVEKIESEYYNIIL